MHDEVDRRRAAEDRVRVERAGGGDLRLDPHEVVHERAPPLRAAAGRERIHGGDDQPVPRPRHRDIEEAPLLVDLEAGLRFLAQERDRDRERLVPRVGQLARAHPRDDDGIELEPLCLVDRHDPHRAGRRRQAGIDLEGAAHL
ncbi:MAG: hypothetical protein MUE82_12525, partial [Chloroflexi bacterium]|nr:hypothetical protein [Chloroflexota bacterium]